MSYSGVDEDEAGKDGEAGNVEHFRCSRTQPAEAAGSMKATGFL
jgi:hypothetical protein